MWYVIILFMVVLADAIMSYAAPVIIEDRVKNAGLMGLILASSSFAGMIVDFLFAKSFVGKKYHFFLRILLASALFFPLSLLFFQFIPSLIFGMVVWGVYFEAMVFSNYHAIHEFVPPHSHVKAWGILALIRNISFVIGPFIASEFGGPNLQTALYIAFTLYILAIIMFIFFKGQIIWHASTITAMADNPGRSFFQELKIWKTFSISLWPLLIFLLLFYLIDSAFYSVGPLVAEYIKEQSNLGSLFLSLYTLPGLATGLLASWLAKPFGKKRIAFLAGIVSGGFLVLMSFQTSPSAILVTTFLAAVGLGIIFPELLAVFENYVSRVGKSGNDLIGLTALFASLAYVLGPIANGIFYQIWGYEFVFRFWGILLTLYSVLLFFLVPRKVRMPQQEIEEALESSTPQ